MTIQEKIDNYKEALDKLKRSYDQAKGALDARMKILKDQFGFTSIEDAQKQLKKYEKEAEGLKKELDVKVTNFEKTYKGFLPI